MYENYHQALQYHASDSSWAHGAGADGLYRQGIHFEPVMNCPGVDGGNRHVRETVLPRSLYYYACDRCDYIALLNKSFVGARGTVGRAQVLTVRRLAGSNHRQYGRSARLDLSCMERQLLS
eukprot:SAG22_NODE_151_length_17414_cov_7.812128_13_plen_121_part_00